MNNAHILLVWRVRHNQYIRHWILKPLLIFFKCNHFSITIHSSIYLKIGHLIVEIILSICIVVKCSAARDAVMCKTNRGGVWDTDYCMKYINVPYEYCPIMCNWCPGKTLLQCSVSDYIAFKYYTKIYYLICYCCVVNCMYWKSVNAGCSLILTDFINIWVHAC